MVFLYNYIFVKSNARFAVTGTYFRKQSFINVLVYVSCYLCLFVVLQHQVLTMLILSSTLSAY